MDELWNFGTVIITRDEMMTSLLCGSGFTPINIARDRHGIRIYIFNNTPEAHETLEKFKNKTLMINAYDFWEAISQSDLPTNSPYIDFDLGKLAVAD